MTLQPYMTNVHMAKKASAAIYPSLWGLTMIQGHWSGGGDERDEINPSNLDGPLPPTFTCLESHRACSCKSASDAQYDQCLFCAWLSPASVEPMESGHPSVCLEQAKPGQFIIQIITRSPDIRVTRLARIKKTGSQAPSRRNLMPFFIMPRNFV